METKIIIVLESVQCEIVANEKIIEVMEFSYLDIIQIVIQTDDNLWTARKGSGCTGMTINSVVGCYECF